MRAVELFVGAGGLAMGVSEAGFRPEAVVEWDRWACDTIRENQGRGTKSVVGWPLHEMDVREFDYSGIPEDVHLLAGGPPCQPFSIGGKHRGYSDERDMFPEMVRAMRELRPRVVLIENVKGLTRQTFAKYLEYVLLQISHPEVVRKPGEEWTDHLSSLERHHTHGRRDGLQYRVVFRLLNAANHGVPQKRERVFIVGFRDDLEVEWSFPEATHSLDALLHDQWVSGDYWERHEVPSRERPEPPPRLRGRIERLRGSLFPPAELPWATVRDAIADLPDPETAGAEARVPNHRFQPGARSYKGHTGSPLDEPAKTLKAGVHGVPGGENMLARPDGSVRYFTVRESARLQTFPDDYVFHGAWSETMRQLGNAVPVSLGRIVASDIASRLRGSRGPGEGYGQPSARLIR